MTIRLNFLEDPLILPSMERRNLFLREWQENVPVYGVVVVVDAVAQILCFGANQPQAIHERKLFPFVKRGSMQ